MSVPLVLSPQVNGMVDPLSLDAVLTPPPTPPLDAKMNDCPSCPEPSQLLQSAFQPNFKHDIVLDSKSVAAAAATTAATSQLFCVQLDLALAPDELVALTGDVPALGEWQLERAISLRSMDGLQWSTSVLLPASTQVLQYRYFTYMRGAHGEKMLRRWETHLQPRLLNVQAPMSQANMDRFGVNVAGELSHKHGWLTNESILQLKFTREQHFVPLPGCSFNGDNCIIKVLPVANSCCSIDVTKLGVGDCRLQPQPDCGVSFERGNAVIFQLRLPHPVNKFACQLLFLNSDYEPLGKCCLSYEHLLSSAAELELPIMSIKSEPEAQELAKLKLPYLWIKPMPDAGFDFRTTYINYWPKCWPSLDLGHRGNGCSYSTGINGPKEQENTINSFRHAYESKADMIELDVHLTTDGVPIIWHDFAVKTAPAAKQVSSPGDLEVVLISDLSYAQLCDIRVFSVDKQGNMREHSSHNAEPDVEKRVFPRLVDVLASLPIALGIDVEIKWPQGVMPAGVEAPQSIDKNFFVDRVLQVILQHGGGRPLFFSSFDGDICSMLRYKQNLLPVMFLTMGLTKKYQPFQELYTRSFEQAVSYAQAFELTGTAAHAEDFLCERGPEMMQLARKLGQVVVVWGDDLNSKERVLRFREMGAHGVCFDRMDVNLPPGKTSNFFNRPEVLAIFATPKKQ